MRRGHRQPARKPRTDATTKTNGLKTVQRTFTTTSSAAHPPTHPHTPPTPPPPAPTPTSPRPAGREPPQSPDSRNPYGATTRRTPSPPRPPRYTATNEDILSLTTPRPHHPPYPPPPSPRAARPQNRVSRGPITQATNPTPAPRTIPINPNRPQARRRPRCKLSARPQIRTHAVRRLGPALPPLRSLNRPSPPITPFVFSGPRTAPRPVPINPPPRSPLPPTHPSLPPTPSLTPPPFLGHQCHPKPPDRARSPGASCPGSENAWITMFAATTSPCRELRAPTPRANADRKGHDGKRRRERGATSNEVAEDQRIQSRSGRDRRRRSDRRDGARQLVRSSPLRQSPLPRRRGDARPSKPPCNHQRDPCAQRSSDEHVHNAHVLNTCHPAG